MPTLLVIGTGLMGASFAMAARRANIFDVVLGCDRDARAAAAALEMGAVDEVVSDLGSGVARADAVLVAVPTGAIADLIRAVAAAQSVPRPIFDLGGVKAPILAALAANGGVPPQFVPCHPMAGSEAQGAAAASDDLFRGRTVIVTPHDGVDPAAAATVRAWWRRCGAEIVSTDAARHDAAVGLTSHLPHVVAFELMAQVGDDDALFPFAGPGFRDFTRIAGSDPALWRHVLLDNRAEVIAALDGLLERLERIRRLLADGDAVALEAALQAGRDARRRYLERDGG